MKRTLSFEEALHKAAAYCSLAEKCPYDVREKLRAWEVLPAEVEKIITQLQKEKFLDEARYCQAFAKDKFRFAKWGRQKIAYALQAKQLPSDAIRAAMETIDESYYADSLKELLLQKQKTLRYKDEYEKKAKLMRFAQSRGFELRAINEAMKGIK